MSDLHLGARQSQTDNIIKFLEENESLILILNGDIIDGWALKNGGKWKKECSKIFRRFMKRSETGTKVVYIRGNHDDFLKPFVPFFMNNIQIVRKYMEKEQTLASRGPDLRMVNKSCPTWSSHKTSQTRVIQLMVRTRIQSSHESNHESSHESSHELLGQ